MVHCHLSKGIIGAHSNSLVLSGGGGVIGGGVR
jgi:hypothetical protein